MDKKYSSLQELIIKGEELRKENERQTFALVDIKPSYYVDGNATITGILVNGAGEKLPVNMYLAPLIEYLNNNSQPLETIGDKNISNSSETTNDEEQIATPLTTTAGDNSPSDSNETKVESTEEKLARLDQEASNGLMNQTSFDENQDFDVPSIEELHASVKPSVEINIENSLDSTREAEFNEDMLKAANMTAEERNEQIEQRDTEYNSHGYQEPNDENEELDGD